MEPLEGPERVHRGRPQEFNEGSHRRLYTFSPDGSRLQHFHCCLGVPPTSRSETDAPVNESPNSRLP